MAQEDPKPRRRFVDCHVHAWNTAENPSWYQFPTPDDEFGRSLGWKDELPPVWLYADHRRAMASADVVKYVHVTGVSFPEKALQETLWLDAMAKVEGFPDAIMGSVGLEQPLADVQRDVDANLQSDRFRGIRLQQGIDYESALGQGVMQHLASRHLVYDAVAHPGGGIRAVAQMAKRHADLVVVLEHTGWPRKTKDADPAYYQAWKDEVRELAAVETSIAKLSGMGMTYHRTTVADFKPYWDYLLEHFGPSRCMFASNFPVDDKYGSFDDLFAVFEATAASLSKDEQAEVFEHTAERVYRI